MRKPIEQQLSLPAKTVDISRRCYTKKELQTNAVLLVLMKTLLYPSNVLDPSYTDGEEERHCLCTPHNFLFEQSAQIPPQTPYIPLRDTSG